MSQYPSPYTPPPYYPQYAGHYPQQDLLAPARRAGWMMLAIAAALCFCGVCMAGFSRVNLADLPAESRMQFDEFQRQFQQTGLSLKTFFVIYGVLMLVPAVVMGVLAFFVRRGGLVALILALILSVGLALLLGVSMVSALVTGGIQAMFGICLAFLPMAALILLINWLIQALRNRPQISAAQAQYQPYYQQYQQAQQAYLQAYGYGPPAQQPPAQNPPPAQGPSDAPPQG